MRPQGKAAAQRIRGLLLGDISGRPDWITSPIVQRPDWTLPFELMCDASDYAVGAVLGQRKEKALHVIHYASKTLDDAQINYMSWWCHGRCHRMA